MENNKIQNNNTESNVRLGQPGPATQGYNSGVVLYRPVLTRI